MTSLAYKVPSQFEDTYINELENISRKERHGLFTQPPPLTLGDKYNDTYKSSGKEKHILINPSMKKNYEPSLFKDPNYISINDPFKESFKQKQIYEKERVMAIDHPKPFKPTDGNNKKLQASEYQHMKEFDDKQFNRRTSAGKVKIDQKNFLTNPSKKGLGNTTHGHLFSANGYQSDPFDLFEERERKERILHRSKFLHQNKGFYSTSHGNRPFTAERQLFDGAGYNPQVTRATYKKYAFRPSNPNKIGYPGCFERLEHMEEGGSIPKTKTNMMMMTQNSEKPWRPNSNGTFARPQPSINQQLKKRALSQTFTKKF